ncbi:energy-coupling factor ABC transporter ATP-binding protein [Galbitalea soli]|uniref:Energy-coupling factor ABC transporter ATP-binding protein n=1 Tax=Galbitalea soli TaxID=1268042 RepID=A0A7C9TQ41_9MICO|nr:energy-coupling factor ABC transporter ATP-binding protein [Galbitalea soli]NEM90955.1 energy-coupling factor ABC transporter ATP-binding protein [Galbitalea soli]NYJ29642.1 biotin transport system ATP-binding protein [Galbitalea soli]
MTGISAREVGVEFDGRVALRGVSVELTERRIAVIGSNGSGKSTFARLLNGLVAPTTGSLTVHGLDPAHQARELRRRVGFIFSNPDAQIIMPTVAEDVAYSLRGRGLARDEVRDRVTAILERFGLAAHADAPAHALSSGQKQLLALSAVLITEPALLVADEPTALLDARNTRRIAAALLDELPQQLVLVTHDLRLAARCDVALWFDDGRLIAQGSPAELLARYEREHA